MAHPYYPDCKCYVRYLIEEVVFGLRFGAHNPACPVYRVSLDSVDRANDDNFREMAEIGAPDVDSHECEYFDMGTGIRPTCPVCGARSKNA